MSEAMKEHGGRSLRRFKPYPAYTDSGVECLGKIPAHWDLKRLRTTVTGCQNGVWGDEPDGLNDVACVRVADFDRAAFRVNMVEPTLRCVEQQIVQARGLHAGDLLLEKSGGGENQPVGSVVLYDHEAPAVCSNFIARMSVADGFAPRFLTYLHAALYVARINTRSIKQSTGIQNLDSASYLSEAAAFPQIDEQRAIASFLDQETTKIDAMVTKKERLIELLQERRTALITRAVTQGLEPGIPMKDSGVEWLGKIPAHWEVKPLKGLLVRNDSGVWGEDFDDEGIPVLRSTEQTVEGHWNIQDPARRRLSKREATAAKLEIGDLVTTKSSGSEAHIGKTSMVDERLASLNCCFSNFMQRLRVDPRNDPRLIWYLLNSPSGREQLIYRSSTTTGLGNLNAGILGSVLVPHAAIEEQRAIAAFLERETAKIDALLAKIRAAIGCLKELRTALISAAVNGKIDVRGEVA